jgi:transposase
MHAEDEDGLGGRRYLRSASDWRSCKLVGRILGAKVEVVKRNELHKFAVIPKRWVVERSFAWLEKCRRLWKNCEHGGRAHSSSCSPS